MLMLSIVCVFSQSKNPVWIFYLLLFTLVLSLNKFSLPVPHEFVYLLGCNLNGSAEIQFEFDAEQILYVDFQQKKNVYTIPAFIDPDPSQIMADRSVIQDSLTNRKACLALMALQAAEEENPPEQRGKFVSVFVSLLQ